MFSLFTACAPSASTDEVNKLIAMFRHSNVHLVLRDAFAASAQGCQCVSRSRDIVEVVFTKITQRTMAPAASAPSVTLALLPPGGCADTGHSPGSTHVRAGERPAPARDDGLRLESAGAHPPVVQRRKIELGAREPSREELRSAASVGLAGAGGPLPHLDAIQRSFGRHDVTSVEAHTGAAAAEGAARMSAEAFATGDRVAFARPPSLRLAAHEATHVVQQRAGARPKHDADHDPLEQHANRVADAVVQGGDSQSLLDGCPVRAPASAAPPPIQRDKVKVDGGVKKALGLNVDEIVTEDLTFGELVRLTGNALTLSIDQTQSELVRKAAGAFHGKLQTAFLKNEYRMKKKDSKQQQPNNSTASSFMSSFDNNNNNNKSSSNSTLDVSSSMDKPKSSAQSLVAYDLDSDEETTAKKEKTDDKATQKDSPQQQLSSAMSSSSTSSSAKPSTDKTKSSAQSLVAYDTDSDEEMTAKKEKTDDKTVTKEPALGDYVVYEPKGKLLQQTVDKVLQNPVGKDVMTAARQASKSFQMQKTGRRAATYFDFNNHPTKKWGKDLIDINEDRLLFGGKGEPLISVNLRQIAAARHCQPHAVSTCLRFLCGRFW